MYSPFGMNTARQGFGQQGYNQPYDFKGLESRLGKIETGIAGLTDQFKNFKIPGQETVDPVYTGNTAPNPLTTTEPMGGIQSLPPAQNTGFNFDPQGITTDQWGNEQTGNLQAQLAQAYGGQTHNEQMGRGPAGFTQGFSDFFTGEGYYADPRGTFADGPWSISETPITLGSRMGGTLDPYGNPQGAMQDLQPRSPTLNNLQPPGPKTNPFQSGNLISYPPNMPQSTNPMAYATINPNLGAYGPGAGLAGLATYQHQQNKGPGI